MMLTTKFEIPPSRIYIICMTIHHFLAITFVLILHAHVFARAETGEDSAVAPPWASGLPVVEINTRDGVGITSKRDYVDMTFSLIDPGDSANNVFKTDTADQIRGRGNDSWVSNRSRKKSFRVRFREKTGLLGLEPARNWVLHAQHRDETLLYNTVAFELGNRFGFRFNHTFNFVDLYINGEYRGNFLLTEQNEVGAGRVDIDRKEGWFVEIDQYYDTEPKFRTESYDLPVMIKWPRPRNRADVTNPAYDSLKKHLNDLTNALASLDFPESGYRELIDINTFVDFLMVNEIVANTDLSHPRSTFIYRDKGGLISMGPLWDFDSGYGWHYQSWLNSTFNDHFNFPDRSPPVHDFFRKFYDDPVFLAKYKERWNEVRDTAAAVGGFIDEMADRLEKSAEKNFEHWWYKTYAPFTDTRFPQPNDFRDAIKRLKNWYAARMFYLDIKFNRIDALPKAKIFETAASSDYPDILPQSFTLVSYGEISNLEVRMHRARASVFEAFVADTFSQLPTGNGGYISSSAISVKPKAGLRPAVYHDTLILSAGNQGKTRITKIPLDFIVAEPPAAAVTSAENEKPLKGRRSKRASGWTVGTGN